MKSYMEMERIWQDDDFFELKITCSSEVITATTKFYTTNENIDNLSKKIKRILSGDTGKCLWKNGEKGDGATAFVSLEFSHKDKLGHIQIEVYMELDDGGCLSKHNCCFFVETELGLLEKFCENIYKLKEQQIGNKICLNFKEPYEGE